MSDRYIRRHFKKEVARSHHFFIILPSFEVWQIHKGSRRYVGLPEITLPQRSMGKLVPCRGNSNQRNRKTGLCKRKILRRIQLALQHCAVPIEMWIKFVLTGPPKPSIAGFKLYFSARNRSTPTKRLVEKE